MWMSKQKPKKPQLPSSPCAKSQKIAHILHVFKTRIAKCKKMAETFRMIAQRQEPQIGSAANLPRMTLFPVLQLALVQHPLPLWDCAKKQLPPQPPPTTK